MKFLNHDKPITFTHMEKLDLLEAIHYQLYNDDDTINDDRYLELIHLSDKIKGLNK